MHLKIIIPKGSNGFCYIRDTDTGNDLCTCYGGADTPELLEVLVEMTNIVNLFGAEKLALRLALAELQAKQFEYAAQQQKIAGTKNELQ